MKRNQMFVPLVFLLLTTLTVSPALAAKNSWNIDYTLTGSIWNQDSADYGKSNGIISLTVSGKIVGAPDFETENSVVDWPIDYGYGMGGEYDYWEDGAHYLVKYFSEVRIVGYATYTESVSKWYSPQPKFNGRLVAIWYDGSTSSFNVDLSPSLIEKNSREGTVRGTYSYYAMESIYEEVDGDWVLFKETVEEGSEDFVETYSESNVHLLFSDKIQDKGRPPYKGTLELWEVVSGNYRIGYGLFGPYDLNIYQSVATVPPPAPLTV